MRGTPMMLGQATCLRWYPRIAYKGKGTCLQRGTACPITLANLPPQVSEIVNLDNMISACPQTQDFGQTDQRVSSLDNLSKSEELQRPFVPSAL
jgi:hypothetical protein